MSTGSDSFGKAILDSMSSPFEKLLNQDNIKEYAFRTSKVLISRLGPKEPGKELIEINSGLFDGPVRLVVDTKTLESKSVCVSSSNIQTSEEKSLFFDVIESHAIVVPWVTAQEALKSGYEITRYKWQEQKVFMTIYNCVKDEKQTYLDLKLFYQDKKDCSTGWAPSIEDKEANDWLIKRKS